jgi:YspA, cpYpsA-related SLOG family
VGTVTTTRIYTVAVVGSREFPDRRAVETRIAELHIIWHPDLCVISGGAHGVDTWVREKCAASKIRYEEFAADWNENGRAAGFIRNEAMVKRADLVIAFWDGESKGTKHTIDLALRHRKPLEVHFPRSGQHTGAAS